MPKPRKPTLPKGPVVQPAQLERWFTEAEHGLLHEEYETTIHVCLQAIASLPARVMVRADFLAYLGNAYGMLKRFEQAYQALFEATKINPSDATLWHNLAQSARYTMRTGEALSYFERAVELETDQSQARKFTKEVDFTRKIVASELKLRGRGFTLEQLIEQQSLFREANNLMESHHWAEAEESLRRVIDIADVLPQPWGNLGLCLIMQRRFDEAEAALRRALVIDRKYDLAQQNLKALPEIRKSGQLPNFQLRDPMVSAKVSQTVVFDKK
jgi:tetratricopeptide (TPR) repeat protein